MNQRPQLPKVASAFKFDLHNVGLKQTKIKIHNNLIDLPCGVLKRLFKIWQEKLKSDSDMQEYHTCLFFKRAWDYSSVQGAPRHEPRATKYTTILPTIKPQHSLRPRTNFIKPMFSAYRTSSAEFVSYTANSKPLRAKALKAFAQRGSCKMHVIIVSDYYQLAMGFSKQTSDKIIQL